MYLFVLVASVAFVIYAVRSCRPEPAPEDDEEEETDPPKDTTFHIQQFLFEEFRDASRSLEQATSHQLSHV